MRDQVRCYIHGGRSPQALAKAVQRRTERAARRTLESLGTTEPCTDAVAALEDLAGQAVALTDILRHKVADLEEIRYKGGVGDGVEQVRGELQAYLAAMGQCERILRSIIALNLDARRVRVQEAQVAIMVKALAKVLGHRDLALNEDRQRRARALLAHELGVTPAIEATATATVSPGRTTKPAGAPDHHAPDHHASKPESEIPADLIAAGVAS